MTGPRGVALAQTAAAAFIWGTSFPVISVAIRGGLDPRLFVFLRFAIAAAVMVAVSEAYGKGAISLLKTKAVWVIGFFNAVGFVCQFIGQANTGASVAALLVNLSVVVAAAGAALFLNERMTAPKVIGVALAAAGVAFLTTGGDISLVSGGELLGDLLYILAAFAWAAYIVYAKKETDETGWDAFAASSAIVAATAVFVLPVALTAGGVPALSALSWEAILYMSLVNTAVAFSLYQAGLKHLSAASSSVVLTLEIATAVGISAIFLGEALSTASWAGAALVVLSVLFVSAGEADGKDLSVAAAGEKRSRTPGADGQVAESDPFVSRAHGGAP